MADSHCKNCHDPILNKIELTDLLPEDEKEFYGDWTHCHDNDDEEGTVDIFRECGYENPETGEECRCTSPEPDEYSLKYFKFAYPAFEPQQADKGGD